MIELTREEVDLILERRKSLEKDKLSEKEQKELEIKTKSDKILELYKKEPTRVFYLLEKTLISGGYLEGVNSKELRDIGDNEGSVCLKKNTAFVVCRALSNQEQGWLAFQRETEDFLITIEVKIEELGLIFKAE